MATKNSIQVGIKVRPLLAKEKDMASYWQTMGNTIKGGQSEPFCFDYVFDQDVSNRVIFEKMAQHVVHSAVRGFNGTIFAYGQTASGKTYTMMGEKNDPGVMVLAAKEIFNEIERMENCQFLLRGGFIEIYNEKIYDLLSSKSGQELKIHDMPNGYADVNCEEICITSEEGLLKVLQIGNEARTVGETNMNERSSRSHAIFRLIIESRQTDIEDDDKVTQSVLNLVDLAGSERADQTGARGARLKEGGHINKSLLFLSTVIKRLSESEDNKYVNYRDSKLTRILQASLGGNAFTSIICTVTPTSIEETLSTLNFAMRAKTVKNKPHVNEIVSDATMMKRLTREIKTLKRQLEEEKRRNASQKRLAQIEELLGCTELKFINTSTHNFGTRKENRRRTWCAESQNLPDVAPTFINDITNSRLKPPVHCTPLITLRDVDNNIPLPSKMHVLQEEFEPAECFDFDKSPSSLRISKEPNKQSFERVSMSPNVRTSDHVKLLEEQLQSLQDFVNLEKEFDIQHDVFGNFKFKLEAMRQRNEILENERIEYLSTKNELELIKEELKSSENRCDILQVEITKLTNAKRAADNKIKHHEAELLQLKSTIERLEIENCNAVSLEFEFETHCKKSKLREKELLEVIDEKIRCIAGLEKQLKTLQTNRLNQSKEELMQLVRCSTFEGTKNGQNIAEVNNTDGESPSVCLKCIDLQLLLDDNKKINVEFEKLTLQYRELQLNYQKITGNTQLNFQNFNQSQIEETKSSECEKLRNEILTLRQKLEKVKSEYEAVIYDHKEKSERCESLHRQVEVAHEEAKTVQNKYAILENSFQEQEKKLSAIESDYGLLEKRYNDLRATYENLEHSSTKCSVDCKRLQNQNDNLQKEVQNLKTRVKGMQTELLNELEPKKESQLIENNYSKAYSEMQIDNQRLQDKLKELQTQYDNLREEYDQLSTNIMETLSENDFLTASNKVLNAERIKWEAERASMEEQIREMQNRFEMKSLTTSCSTSGILLSDDDEVHRNRDINYKTTSLLESVNLIELVNGIGQRRIYTASDSYLKPENALNYKLSLENWQRIDVGSDSIEFGNIKAFIRHIETSEEGLLKEKVYSEETVRELKDTIENLQDQLNELQLKYKALYESAQRDVVDLREEIKRLTKELCEKSMVLDDFVKEKAEITLLKEELQMKIALSQSEVNISSSTISPANQTVSHENSESMNEVFARSYDDTLKTKKTELMYTEEEYNQLKLEMLEKLEISESEFRCHLRKYNEEWEQRCLKYEEKIKELEKMLTEVDTEIKKEEDQDESYDEGESEKSFSNNMVEDIKNECEENYAAFDGAQKSSTPNTPSQSISHFEHYSKVQKDSLERSKLVQECNEEISKLHVAMKNAKEINANLSELLTEKEELLEIKDAEVKELKVAIAIAESKVKGLSENEEIENVMAILNETIEKGERKVQDLMNRIVNLETDLKGRDIEISRLKSAVEKTECETRELKVKLTIIEDEKAELVKEKVQIILFENNLKSLKEELKRESLLKHEMGESKIQLQNEYDILLKERNSLLENVNELLTQSKADTEKIDKINSELSELKQRFSTVLSEKENLKRGLDESTKCKLQIESDIKVLEASQKELTETLKLKECINQELEQMKNQCAEKEILIETMKRQVESFNEVNNDRKRLHAELMMLKSQYAVSEKTLEAEKTDLIKELEECNKRREQLKEKSEVLTTKLDAFKQELHESKLQSVSLEKKLQDYREMEKQYDSINQTKKELELEIIDLRKELNQLKDARQLEVVNLQRELEQLQASLKLTTTQKEDLFQQISLMQIDLREMQNKTQREVVELQSQLEELKYKYEETQDINSQLAVKNKEIEQHLEEAKLKIYEHIKERELLHDLQSEKDILKDQLKKTEKTCEDLRGTLNANEIAKSMLESTMASLQTENKNLIERMEALNEIVKQRSDICESANNSMESSLHSQNSPLAHWSPCKKNGSTEDKFSSLQKERKNRRLSTHDENRRQSSKFTVYVDASMMTEQVKNNCECASLKEKLSECETNLYIRDSQVKALQYEVRNHPLKTENQALTKRIQEEQEKNRIEAKKYKTKIAEQAAQLQSLIRQNNTAMNVPVRVETSDQGTSISPRTNLKAVETQTDMEIDQTLHKLQGKYNDLKNVCRFRYNRISKLEKMLEEKENILRGHHTSTNQQQSQQIRK